MMFAHARSIFFSKEQCSNVERASAPKDTRDAREDHTILEVCVLVKVTVTTSSGALRTWSKNESSKSEHVFPSLSRSVKWSLDPQWGIPTRIKAVLSCCKVHTWPRCRSLVDVPT